MKQSRREWKSEEQYALEGFVKFVIHERDTGAECVVYARTASEAKRRYRSIRSLRDQWAMEYERINERAMAPFMRRREERMANLYNGKSGEDFDSMSMFDMLEETD